MTHSTPATAQPHPAWARNRGSPHEIVPSINAGNPIPLLIIEARHLPDVSDNHQVLAIGYFRRGGPNGQAVVEIYDPDFPGRVMYLNTSENNGFPIRVETLNPAGQDVVAHFYGFFSNNSNYSYHKPDWALAQPTGNLPRCVAPSLAYLALAAVSGQFVFWGGAKAGRAWTASSIGQADELPAVGDIARPSSGLARATMRGHDDRDPERAPSKLSPARSGVAQLAHG